MRSVREQWVPEVREKGPRNALLMLVGITGTVSFGTSADACPDGGDDKDSNENSAVGPVGHEEGAALARKIGASRYFECNIQDVSSVNAVVHEAVRVLRAARGSRGRAGCVLQ